MNGDGNVVIVGLWLFFLQLAGASPRQAGAAGDATWAPHPRRRPRHQRGRLPLSSFLPPRPAEDRAGFAPVKKEHQDMADDETSLKWAKEDYIREQMERQRQAFEEIAAR